MQNCQVQALIQTGEWGEKRKIPDHERGTPVVDSLAPLYLTSSSTKTDIRLWNAAQEFKNEGDENNQIEGWLFHPCHPHFQFLAERHQDVFFE